MCVCTCMHTGAHSQYAYTYKYKCVFVRVCMLAHSGVVCVCCSVNAYMYCTFIVAAAWYVCVVMCFHA